MEIAHFENQVIGYCKKCYHQQTKISDHVEYCTNVIVLAIDTFQLFLMRNTRLSIDTLNL